ncbi:class I SAM-dependent methyltransferase [Novosphingobium malaysiense]|uniref:Phospholipid methyltransferase n=1 Tax=Novosphingobium malaysiense TaxID=1348853 RepID=A0A0B1ZPJ4_9SPHN|nr:class I SAM-dependent methyltransferase [Novosphingobium malaysiense]KHK91173.1 phospholipid methyltransferase [Novosphingobium malaysiense]
MGLARWWDETVVPRIIRCGCAQAPIMEIRQDVVPLASGRVLEMGCGGGINQQLYDPARIEHFAGLDPSGKGLDYARAAAEEKGWSADIRQGVAEDIPFADESFDTVVCTFTLCSVNDHGRSLSELRRVLRPGGTLLFAEHGRSPEAKIARWQERIDPVWSKLFGNCHLSRPVTSAVAASGFSTEPSGARYMSVGPRFAGWMEWGRAVKTG